MLKLSDLHRRDLSMFAAPKSKDPLPQAICAALACIDELEAHVVELREALDTRGPFHDEHGDCFFCDNSGRISGHAPTCRYVAIMAKTDPAR